MDQTTGPNHQNINARRRLELLLELLLLTPDVLCYLMLARFALPNSLDLTSMANSVGPLLHEQSFSVHMN